MIEEKRKKIQKDQKETKEKAEKAASRKRKREEKAAKQGQETDKKAEMDVKEAKKKAKRKKHKALREGKKKQKGDGPKQNGTTSDDATCLYCAEMHDEEWIQCTNCKRWAHTECAGVDEHDEGFICELCCD